MKKISNRIISMMIIFALCLCTTSVAFASEPEYTPALECKGSNVVTVTVEVVDAPANVIGAAASTRSYDQLINLATTDFSWEGNCSCVIGRNYTNVGIMAGISSNSVGSGTVYCSVKLPNGGYQGLGNVSARGGTTAITNFPTVQSGTYTFYFDANCSATINGFGYIYKG